MDKNEINKFLSEIVLWVSKEEYYTDEDVFEIKIRNRQDLIHCVYALLGYGIRFEVIPSGIIEDEVWISIQYNDMIWEMIINENK